MKSTTLLGVAAVAAVLGAPVAQAQEQGRVLSSTPILQQVSVPRQVCGNEMVYNNDNTSGAGAVIGAIAGGILGNQVGGGTGRAAATAVGVIGGAVVGNQIESQGRRPGYQNTQRCRTEYYYENRPVGYNVVYEYGGRQYTTQTSYEPGGWIPLNVQPSQGNYGGQTYSTYQNPYPQPGVVQTYPVQPPQYVSPPTTIEYNYNYNYHQHQRRYDGNPYRN